MQDIDKTLVMGSQDFNSVGKCPVCNTDFQYNNADTDELRCPVCGFVQKINNEIAPGNIVAGKYRILSRLGSGGCGELYFCHPLNDVSTRYALKVLKLTDDLSRKRFKREAKLLASMQDEPRIVRVFDYGDINDKSFIVMEFIDGKDLKQLKKEYCFDENTTLQILREVVIALKHLWEDYSVIHRDIKPENIMLDSDGIVKVMDFGLSKQQFEDGNDSQITVAKCGLGTPGYMSPEQFSDSKNVDFRADIFSLGATICFLMTGRKPFKGDNPVDIYHETLVNSPPRDLQFDTECSEGCYQLIQTMMQRYPDDRFYSYSELLDAINKLLAEP